MVCAEYSLVNNDRILVVSDLHAPYMHCDAPAFLLEVKKKYKPTRVVLSGDEADKHAMSFHEHDPDLPSSGDELDQAVAQLQPIYDMFPVADVLDSNHGSMAVRRAVAHGMSRKYLKPYGEVLKSPPKWRWHEWLKLESGGRKIVAAHGMHANVANVVKGLGACFFQGHFHTKAEVTYVQNLDGYTYWGMTVGCLIDDDKLSFRYNKLSLARPVTACGFIDKGNAKIIPMYLDANKRWTGYVP